MARWHAIQVAARMEGLAWSVLSIWSDTNKVENIKLFRRHRAATSNQWRVQADNVTSHTFVYIQTQHGGEANCSCVWAQTRANRSSNWAPVSLRYRWNRSSSRWSSWRRQWNYPSSVCLRRTSWTRTRRWVVFLHFWDLYSRYSAHWWYQPWSTWNDCDWEIPVQKWAGKRVVFIFTLSVKSDKCKWRE